MTPGLEQDPGDNLDRNALTTPNEQARDAALAAEREAAITGLAGSTPASGPTAAGQPTSSRQPKLAHYASRLVATAIDGNAGTENHPTISPDVAQELFIRNLVPVGLSELRALERALADGPVLYAALEDRAIADHARALRADFAAEAGRFAERACRPIHAALRAAYARGVDDGFAQGVQAEAERG